MDQIGRYTLLQQIGHGGMATVYRAADPLFQREVAIKILPVQALHDAALRARFEREARMIAALEHPAIVPVYDLGEQDGQPYIVMRYMAGGSLADRLKAGALPAGEAVRILDRLAQALDAAHARGIIHRDIKPGNVLFDQYGNAFLSDFGIARFLAGEGLTITGEQVLGTPAYMSPEQVHGEKSITGSSDIYALGVLAFQMLSGSQPYHADTPTKLMMMHVLEPAPDIRDFAAGLPGGIEVVLSRALAKDPAERHSSASELVAGLETCLAAPGSQPPSRRPGVQSGLATAPLADAATREAGQTRLLPAEPTSATPPTALVSETEARTPPKSSKRTGLWIALGLIVGVGLLLGALALSSLLVPAMLASLAGERSSAATQLTTPAREAIPAALLPTLTSSPAATSAPTADMIVEAVTATFTPTLEAPIIGGADRLAFILEGDLWLANLDGSQLQRLTEDQTEKTNPQWSADGRSIHYIQGKCVLSVEIASGRIDTVACFNFVDYLRAFETSPDSQQAAISLDNQLYIVPNRQDLLQGVSTRSDLTDIAGCKALAPYTPYFVKSVRWSDDGQTLAAVMIGVSDMEYRADIIWVLDLSQCTSKPHVLDRFPANDRLMMLNYNKNPELQNFAWDGRYLFALNTSYRNDGFGDLYVYNMELHKGRPAINPIDQTCCYRDPQWSPDGNYLLFAYQDMLAGSSAQTLLYYVQYGTVGTGMQYTPLPLPAITDPRAKPQPILRPALGGP